MGNSKSTPVLASNNTVPLKSVLKKPPVPGPVNGFNYYPPPQYMAPPNPPPQYMVPPNLQYYPPNQYPPQPQSTYYMPEQPVSTSHHNHVHHSPRHPPRQHSVHSHRYHEHSPHSHHHYHRHSSHSHRHQRSAGPTENERSTSPAPPARAPSIRIQEPLSTVATNKLASPLANNNPVTSLSPNHRAASVLIEKAVPPVVITQQQLPQPIKSANVVPSLLAPLENFEKAPVVEISFIPKAPDNHSIPSYGPGTLPVVKRSSSQYVASGNKWYDHDYDRRVKPLTLMDV